MRPRRQNRDKPLRCPSCHVGAERPIIGSCQRCQVFWLARPVRPWTRKFYLCPCGYDTRFTLRYRLHRWMNDSRGATDG